MAVAVDKLAASGDKPATGSGERPSARARLRDRALVAREGVAAGSRAAGRGAVRCCDRSGLADYW